VAQKVQILLTCDLDEEDVPAVETVNFSYDDTFCAFELCESHLEEFYNTMQGYISVARQTDAAGRRSRVGASARSNSRAPKEDLGAVREWARANGYQVSDRGRISGEVREAYAAAK
jgi:nucleoid-associated protein Lsr2